MSPVRRFYALRSPLLFLGTLTAAFMACSRLPVFGNRSPIIPTPVAGTPVTLETPTGAPTQSAQSAARGDDGQDPSPEGDSGWLRYRDETFGLSFYYPPEWDGPEVHRWDAGISVEVGTDTVYPYGTGLDERVYEVEDAYFVTVSYVQNKPGWDLEAFVANQPWMQSYVQLLEIEDGQSISDARNLTIRQRELELGSFSGVEYVGTLSETAQTMIFYVREVTLFDEELNRLQIAGSPNNVKIREGEDWRAAYQRVDANYQDTLYRILESVTVE